MKKRSFTIIELIIVIVVAGIIAAIALPNFQKSRVKAQQKEAISNIKLIAAAQRVYRMEHGNYAECSGTACNPILKLILSSANWAYNATGTSTNSITATKGACTYTLTSGNFDAEPAGSGCI